MLACAEEVSPMRFTALVLCFAAVMFGQSAPTTSLSGTVADPSGSLVPDAAIELTNVATRWTRNTITDSQGHFLFTLVPPGRYDLQVTAKGFNVLRQQGFSLDVDVPVNLQLKVAVAGAATSITIQEDAPMVDSQSG